MYKNRKYGIIFIIVLYLNMSQIVESLLVDLQVTIMHRFKFVDTLIGIYEPKLI